MTSYRNITDDKDLRNNISFCHVGKKNHYGIYYWNNLQVLNAQISPGFCFACLIGSIATVVLADTQYRSCRTANLPVIILPTGYKIQ